MTNPTDYKDLCARMADELDHYRQLLMDDRRETHALATEARAAIAADRARRPTPHPEPEGRSSDGGYEAGSMWVGHATRQPEPEGLTDEEPMAWLYKGEPDFNGERWRENWCVTTDKQVARFKAQPGNFIPLFRRPTPQPPITPELVLAQREEILAAFIAKHGFDPDSAIQIEQRQEDGTTTWRIERTPQPPADEEVEELVETLKGIAYWRRHGKPGNLAPTPFDIRQANRLDRAADLLGRFASPACLAVNPSPEAVAALKAAGPGRIELLPDDMQIIEPAEHTVLVPPLKPVPVSERLPGAEDCGPWPDEPDAVHWCWFGSDTYGAWLWEQRSAGEHTYRHLFYTHWLPAHALPLPTSEVAE